MSEKKVKEPLLSLMLTFIYPGLGQIYSGRIRRGVIFFVYNLILSISFLVFALTPTIRTTKFLLSLIPVVVVIGLYIIIDAYRCALQFNRKHELTRTITFRKRFFLIAGIVFFTLFFNVSDLVRNQLFQAFKVPSETMIPTIMKNDRVVANKCVYNKRNPERGDIIVFQSVMNPEAKFVQRIVGLPGDALKLESGQLLVNGAPLLNPPIFSNLTYFHKGKYLLPAKTEKVPEGHYFVLGDNSAISHDSRFWGFLPRKNIIGKVHKIYFPLHRSGPVE